jgi:precorrin-2 dehydrogenase / sirohydrochlorin ferrochelatase
MRHREAPYTAMTRYLPVCLNLEGRRAVIVGGGAVGTQKVRDFADCGAEVTVVSPAASAAIREEADAGRIRLIERRYRPGDVEGAFLVVVATDDPETNAAVYEEANRNGQLVNVCDDPPHCNYIFASRIERGPLTVSIFTHGTSPALARRVRRDLEAWLGPEYAMLAELLAELRPRVRALERLSQPDRQRVFERIVYSEVLLLFREGHAGEARALAERLIEEELSAIGRRGAITPG